MFLALGRNLLRNCYESLRPWANSRHCRICTCAHIRQSNITCMHTCIHYNYIIIHAYLRWSIEASMGKCCRRKFRSQTSDNMDRWKAEQGRGREKRKIRRKKIRRERVRRKKMQMREKVGKSRNTVFFQWFVAPEGRAGAEPAGQMSDEKLHAVVARSRFWSQNVQSTPVSDHFWKLRCRKSARRCGAKHILKSKCTKHTRFGPLLAVEMSKKCTSLWRKARLEVKMCKAHRPRTTFGSWDVEKAHAVVARSTFLKSKCTKHHMFAPLLEVRMLKKCTPLWREAHFEVKMYKTPHVGATFGGSDVEKVHAVVAQSTFPSQNVQNTRGSDDFWRFGCRKSARHWKTRSTFRSQNVKRTRDLTTLGGSNVASLHYTTLHYTPTTLRSTTLHKNYTTLQLQPHNYTPLHSTTLNYTTLHYITLHSTTLHYTTLHYTTFHYTSLHYTTLHSTTLQLQLQLHNHTPLHEITLHYTTLHYTTLHSTTLHYATLHYTTLHYTEWHCTTDRQVDR